MAKSKAEKPAGVPNPIDVHVGKRIRMRRLFLGMKQEALASPLGLTLQQVQKWERAVTRVSASRLSAIGDILGVPISFFFAEFDDRPQTAVERASSDLMEMPETIKLIRLYCAIRDETVRHQALAIVEAIAEASEPLSGARGARKARRGLNLITWDRR